MPRLRLRALTLLAAILAAGLTPAAALACGETEGCDVTNKWISIGLVSETIARDGVVLLDGRRGTTPEYLDDAAAIAGLTAEASLDGEPVTGSFELATGWAGLVWRPDAPLSAGTLSLTIAVDNSKLVDGPADWPCEVENYVVELGPIEVLDTDLPALGRLQASVMQAGEPGLVFSNELEVLDQLVCCDGAMPVWTLTCYPEWFVDEGYCARVVGTGRATFSWSLATEAVPEPLRTNLSWRLEDERGGVVRSALPGTPAISEWIAAPACRRVSVRNWATGEVVALDENCVGDEIADQLGTLTLDPSEELAAACEGEAYVCEVEDEQWNPDACSAWPGEEEGGDGDSGSDESGGPTGEPGSNATGGCSVAGRSRPWPLGLGLGLGLGIVCLARRRRG